MPQPPFRLAIDPLIQTGLFEKASDPLGKFLWYAESLYLDNLLLRSALAKAGIDAEAVLKKQRPSGTSVGSPGPHRRVFDPLYREIALDQLKRYPSLVSRPKSKKRGI
jgi:hypothetical protein